MMATRFSFPNLISHQNQNYSFFSIRNNCCSKRKAELGDVEYLKSEFKTSGVSFTGIGNSCVVGMEVEEGSAAKLMLPSGLITSFKPRMWHGATMELLHTFVSQAQTPPVVQGGLSLALSLHNQASAHSWSPDAWTLHQVRRTPESIRVDLLSTSQDSTCQVKHTITVERDSLKSDILVSNLDKCSCVHVMGSAICHLTVSTPDAVYALGLQASDYFVRPPLESKFSIVPPHLRTFLSKEEDEELSGEEDDNYKHLTHKLSRIYTNAPRSLTIIDRGKRNSVTVRREGFKEVYIFSPGSEHEWYNNYSYICIANSALLQPIILNPQTQWTGALQLWNPNS